MTVNYSQTPTNSQEFDVQEHDIIANGRQIGFHYGETLKDVDLDSVFKLKMYRNEYHIDPVTRQITSNVEHLDVENWQGHDFEGFTFTEDSLHHSFCTKQNDTIKLRGNFGKDDFEILRVDISIWNNNTHGNCSSQEDIDYYTNTVPLFVMLGNSYISFDSGKAELIENTKLIDEYFMSGFTNTLDILVRK